MMNPPNGWGTGFDSTVTQVWGTTKGGYTFKKVRE
jgi:hypothetical protein